jgi:hypothetical protein
MNPFGNDPRGGRRAALLALAILLILAAWLRLSGIGYLLPEVMNRDGLVLVRQVDFLRGASRTAGDDAWRYGFYPHLLARLAALIPEEALPATGKVDLASHLALASAPWIRLREISVALSLLAIPATYLLARRFLDRTSSLFAAALVATSLHHIVLSIQEKPHAAATSFIAIALVAALRLRRKPDACAYLGCGLAAGLAIGTLQNAAICLLPVGAAFLLTDRAAGKASRAWILATIAVLAVSVRLFYPFYFESSDPAGLPGFAQKLWSGLGGAPFGRILAAAGELDPLLASAAVAGIALGIVRNRRRCRAALRGDLGVVLALVVPYLLVLASYRETLVRFFLPLVPLLACAAGYAFQRARERWRPSAVCGFALLAIPLWPAVHFAAIRKEPSPMQEATRWIEAHAAPSDTVVVVPEYDLDLLPTEDAIHENARVPYRTIWTEYLARAAPERLEGSRRRVLVEPGLRPDSRLAFAKDPVAYLKGYGARWLVLDLSGFPKGSLESAADLEQRISPDTTDDPRRWRGRGVVLWGTGYDPLAPSAVSILRQRSLGTAVEIYRVR